MRKKKNQANSNWKYKIICVMINIPICWIMMGVDFVLWPVTLFWAIMMILSITIFPWAAEWFHKLDA